MMRILLLWCITGYATAFAAGGIVVNEYFGGGAASVGTTKMAGTDYIEFALTQNMTSTSLAALTFGDSTATTSSLGGVFKLDKTTLDTALASSGQTSFLAGTIIVVKGASAGAQDLVYTPTASNSTNDAAWSIELVAGQGAKSDAAYLSGAGGDIGIASAGDAVWISTSNPPTSSTDTSGFISGLTHHATATPLGTVGTAIQSNFGASHVFAGTEPAGSSIANVGSDALTILATQSGGTKGAPNGLINTIWIDGLRTGAFPHS